MLIPYRLAFEIHRTTVISIGIAIVCVGVFVLQLRSADALQEALQRYCQTHDDAAFRRVLRAVSGHSGWRAACVRVMHEIHVAEAPDSHIAALADKAPGLAHPNREYSTERIISVLEERYAGARTELPEDLTHAFAYRSDSFDVVRMFTSDVAHGGWAHLVFNLIFFAAFAPAVEAILGIGRFLAALVVIVVAEHLVFSVWHAGADPAVSVIGLSGVVSAMMGLLTYLWPGARIRCLLLIVVFPLRITLPALLLAVGFIGWDVYYLFELSESQVSFVSHVGGFVIAYLYGMMFLGRVKAELPGQISR